MLFVSPEFAVFFLVVCAIYFSIPYRFRWVLILAASYFFYATWNVTYILLILFTTLVDFSAGVALLRTPVENKGLRRLYLAASLGTNLAVLFFFKYFNFFIGSVSGAAHAFGIPFEAAHLQLLLPVGISFYTFQSMAYTIDVYRGTTKAETHLGIFALFVAYFPQLAAGPIERAHRVLPQFHRNHPFDYDRAVSGFRLILWGAFKKVAIADRVALIVNGVYSAPSSYSGSALFLSTLLFGIQIYCDFSAYSDIAIGVARVFGIDLMQNFRQPYFSTSIREFWQRWHISLSTWFREYLYIPLGGNRKGLARQVFNLFIVFVVSGLWHGASWNFVIWGAVHGGLIAFETFMRARNINLLPRSIPASIRAGISLIATYLLVQFAWVFFRAQDFSTASFILTNFFKRDGLSILHPYNTLPSSPTLQMAITLGAIVILIIYDYLDARGKKIVVNELLGNFPVILRWGLYFAILAYTLASFVFSSGTSEQFIYFQF